MASARAACVREKSSVPSAPTSWAFVPLCPLFLLDSLPTRVRIAWQLTKLSRRPGTGCNRFSGSNFKTPRGGSVAVSDTKYEALLKRMRKQREEGRSMIMTVVETVETGASASAHAMVDGYFGPVDVMGVPLGVITGGLLHLLGALGLAPEHMHALGNGALTQPICHASRVWGE